MVKVTAAAIDVISKELSTMLREGEKPFVRLTMGIG